MKMPKLSELLPEDLKTLGDRYAEPADLGKAYIELEKKQGKMVTIDDTPENRARAYDLLGHPKAADDYKDAGPDTPLVKSIVGLASKHRVPVAFVKEAIGTVQAEIGNQSASVKKQMDGDLATLLTSWGDKAAANEDIVRRGAEKITGAALDAYKFLSDTNPALAKRFAFDIGVKEVLEPPEPASSGFDPSLTPETAKARFNDKELNEKAFGQKDPAAISELNKLGRYLENEQKKTARRF